MTLINRAAKPCDYCNLGPGFFYCRNDAAFMCLDCDAKVHVGLNAAHARVLTCEVCEQAPAAVTCKADAASLCVTCDRDIHAANPLAGRHERVAVVPFFETADTLVLKSVADVVCVADVLPMTPLLDDVTTFDTWGFSDLSTVPSKLVDEAVELKTLECFLADDADELFGFDAFGTFTDSVVPVQTSETLTPVLDHFSNDYSAETGTGFDFGFAKPNISSYNSYMTTSLSVSSSSIDVGVVPDINSFTDISFPYMKNPIVITEPIQSSQVIGMDREARVMRYREKKKNRKFEKTVRYASRKAYAETRPRVKGRFAKKTDVLLEMDPMFGNESFNFDFGDRYGVVPSF